MFPLVTGARQRMRAKCAGNPCPPTGKTPVDPGRNGPHGTPQTSVYAAHSHQIIGLFNGGQSKVGSRESLKGRVELYA